MQFNTIVALSTPQGVGALAVVRVSGNKAFQICAEILPKIDFSKVQAYQAIYTPIIYQQKLIDKGIVVVYKAPKSYTGEDVVEFSVHGSTFIVNKLIEALLDCGAEMAQPGEFTQRAFLNQQLDLAQAESVADLIASETEAEHKAALSQLKGNLSNYIKDTREKLMEFAALMELELDFAEEDVEFANRNQLSELLQQVTQRINYLLSTFKQGNAIKQGVKVVIAGIPNAGKSTLLNTLLQDDRALVSDIPGTTRDTVEDSILIDGVRYRFIDTAGLRETNDTIEKMGIERSYDKIVSADVVIYLIDTLTQQPSSITPLKTEAPVMYVLNKTETLVDKEIATWQNYLPNAVAISAKNQTGIEILLTQMKESLGLDNKQLYTEGMITNLRHYEALKSSLQSLATVKEGIENQLFTDLLAFHLRDALEHLGSITGSITNNELLGFIFGKFCIGK